MWVPRNKGKGMRNVASKRQRKRLTWMQRSHMKMGVETQERQHLREKSPRNVRWYPRERKSLRQTSTVRKRKQKWVLGETLRPDRVEPGQADPW